MELYHYLEIIRRRWLIVVALPIIVAIITGVAAMLQEPAYGATAKILVTRPLKDTLAVNDTFAYDLPAIVAGTPFAEDVTETLNSRGYTFTTQQVAAALSASNTQYVVSISANSNNAEDPVRIVQAAVDTFVANNRIYWGDNLPDSYQGMHIAVLNLPTDSAHLNGLRATLINIVLRSFAGFLAGVGIVFLLHYLEAGRQRTRVL